jgi:hypothetical protein
LFYKWSNRLLLNCLHMCLHLGEVKWFTSNSLKDIYNIITSCLKVCCCIIGLGHKHLCMSKKTGYVACHELEAEICTPLKSKTLQASYNRLIVAIICLQ